MTEQTELYIQNGIQKNSRFNLTLYNIFNTKKGKYRTDKIKAIGEAPHLLDSTLIEISRSEIQKFLKTKGYFNARVKTEIEKKDKKAAITFNVDTGARFTIGSISHSIADTAIQNLYRARINSFTHLHSNSTYDQDSLIYDRDQTYLLLARNGYYDYSKSYLRIAIDTTNKPQKADLNIFIDNPHNQSNYSIYKINDSFITIRNSNNRLKRATDTVTLDGQYHFSHYANKYNKKIIQRYLFLKKDEVYDIDKFNVTRDRLYALNIFRNIKIDIKKTPDSLPRLNVFYDITPNKKMSNRIEGACQFNNISNGFKFANTYANRNLFGGAELFEFRTSYDVQFDATYNNRLFKEILSRDFNIGISLSLPKLIPFNFARLNRNGVPRTIFVSNFELFEQRNQFFNRIFVNSMTYNWIENERKTHSFTPLSIEYRIGQYSQDFRATLIARGYNLLIATNDRTFINIGSRYSFTYNAFKLKELTDFNYLNVSVALAGNSTNLISSLLSSKTNANGAKTILGLAFEQYVKPEVDFRIYKFLGMDNQLVFRINPGIGIAYGNTNLLTFEKCFFGGGSQGMRAWQARTLGPGGYNRANIDPTLRNSLRGLDQIGEIKLETNLEYRFKLITKLLGGTLKGALFADCGNIWRIKPLTENPNGEFNINNFMQQIAIGSGFGLRFDLNYFIFRLDIGVKIKDPQFTGTDQWVIRNFFNKKEFKENYQKTNGPDSYSFVNYNIGIGMPF